MTRRFISGYALALLSILGASLPLSRAKADDFFAGKTIDLIVGVDVGGGFDTYARLIARHLPDHIAGAPAVVVRNMPGAGSAKAAAYLYAIAPKDGTSIAALFPGVIIDRLLQKNAAGQFDPTKFTYLASADSDARLCITGPSSKVKTFQQAMTDKVVIGGTQPGAPTHSYAYLNKNATGVKFDIVAGYKGTASLMLAGGSEFSCRSGEGARERQSDLRRKAQGNGRQTLQHPTDVVERRGNSSSRRRSEVEHVKGRFSELLHQNARRIAETTSLYAKLRARCLDHRGPFRNFRMNVGCELLGRITGDVAKLVERMLNARIVQGFDNRLVQDLDDVCRRAGRRHQAVPGRGVEAADAELVDGRNVRQARRALERRHRQRPQLAALDKTHRAGRGGEHHLVLSGDDVLQRRRRAFVRHVHDVDMRIGLEQLAGRCAASP
jgi:hypothetical protein